MKRVLVSWNAYRNDFRESEGGGIEVNPNGTHGDFYKHLHNYDVHYLLSTANQKQGDLRVEHLANYLRIQSKSEVAPVYMDIDDPVSVAEIKQKVLEFLLSVKDNEIEVYISPGTPAMQTVWYLIGQEFKFTIKLFFVRPPDKRKNANPIKEYLSFERSNVPEALIIKDQYSRKVDKNIFILPSNKEAFDRAELIAQTSSVSALIQGETGTGKEIVARHIHQNSSRKSNPFVAINCGAYRDELLESRLFGHVRGAFTGATDTVNGCFHDAEGGTLFLDEIGEISEYMQVALLRVLNQRPCEVIRLGSTKTEKVDVRIIAATNRNLWEMVQAGKFRADLYYRLAVAEINLPPFARYSNKDKKFIIHSMMKLVADNLGRIPLKIESTQLKELMSYPFRGNLRELRYLIERWMTFNVGQVTISEIDSNLLTSNPFYDSLKLKDAERAHIAKVIAMSPNNKRQVCKNLGISYNTLMKKAQDYSLRFE